LQNVAVKQGEVETGGIVMIDRVNRTNQGNQINQRQLNNLQAYPGYGVNFAAMLQEQLHKTNGVQFSKHAQERVEQRGIEVTDTLLDDLNQAVEKAREKGARDVVVIGEKGAFIINVANNMVITTMTQREMKNNVFTNIDSAVIL
jgi:flagellar operon protein